MKYHSWTLGLIGAGLVSLPAVMHAEESSAPSSVLTSLSATTLSGYVDTSAQWNLGTGDTFVPGYAYGGPAKADGFNLNAVKLSLAKPVDLKDAWGAGYQADLFMGPDANTFNSLSATGTGNGDFAVRQAFVTLHAPLGNGLDFKAGVFDTIIGYETTDAPNNPNFTRSYGYTIEPVSHTGVRATYAFSDMLSATAGAANTFGSRINSRAFPTGSADTTISGTQAESYKTYLGSITFTAPTNWGVLGGSTLTGGVINGFNNGVSADQTSWYVGGTLNTPVSGLKVGAAYDYAGISEQPRTGGTSAYANATTLYLSYQLTEKLTVYGRGEYASASTPGALGSTSLAGGTGPTKVFAATGTLQYDLWKNVVSRLEFRWDHAADGVDAYGTGPTPTKRNSYIFLANIAYKF